MVSKKPYVDILYFNIITCHSEILQPTSVSDTAIFLLIKLSEYDQEKLQSQTADKPMEELDNNQETPGRQTEQSNQLSLPHKNDCKTRKDIK